MARIELRMSLGDRSGRADQTVFGHPRNPGFAVLVSADHPLARASAISCCLFVGHTPPSGPLLRDRPRRAHTPRPIASRPKCPACSGLPRVSCGMVKVLDHSIPRRRFRTP